MKIFAVLIEKPCVPWPSIAAYGGDLWLTM